MCRRQDFRSHIEEGRNISGYHQDGIEAEVDHRKNVKLVFACLWLSCRGCCVSSVVGGTDTGFRIFFQKPIDVLDHVS